MNGTVSNILSSKGYGFISGENGQEYFFHMTETLDWNAIIADFKGGGAGFVKVTFDPIKTPKGPRASNVVMVVE